MPIGQSLADFQASVAQCDNLITNAHTAAPGGAFHFTPRDREQITVAAFLNMFIAWEEFIEASIGDFMMGEATIGGNQPARYVAPPTRDHSGKMVIHMNRYFDYASHENVKKLARLYFNSGYPFDTPINSLTLELSDLKIMRNACAHMSSTTKAALEGLGLRIFGSPQAGITVYAMLTADDPRTNPRVTVYASYRDKLLVAAGLIAQG
jgi:hypothetical protein